MDCTELAPLLAGHAENALPAIERAAAMSHLADCKECTARMRTLTARAGRLEAVLAPYHVDLAGVEAHLSSARAALGRRWREVNFAPVLIALLMIAPGIVAAIVGLFLGVFDVRAWWFPGGSEYNIAASFVAGLLVPTAAAIFYLSAWRRMRRENKQETFESILLALMAGGCAWLAWWPVVGSVLEGTVGHRLGGGGATRANMADSQLIFSCIALFIATLVTAPLVHRPALSRPGSSTTEFGEPKKAALRTKLQNLLRLFCLAAFELQGDLLEATRAGEEEFDSVVHRLGEVPDEGAPLRAWAAEIARDVVGEASGGRNRSTLSLKKVATRRELEQTLHGLPEDARAVTYLRVAQKTPLSRIIPMLQLPAATVVRGYGLGLDALAAFGDTGTNTDTRSPQSH